MMKAYKTQDKAEKRIEESLKHYLDNAFKAMRKSMPDIEVAADVDAAGDGSPGGSNTAEVSMIGMTKHLLVVYDALPFYLYIAHVIQVSPTNLDIVAPADLPEDVAIQKVCVYAQQAHACVPVDMPQTLQLCEPIQKLNKALVYVHREHWKCTT